MKVLANDGISQEGAALLTQAGFEVLEVKVAQNQLESYINEQNISVLLVRSSTQVTPSIIKNCPSLKLIGRAGVGLDNIAVKEAQSKGIEVVSTPEASAQSVAELVFAHLFTGVRFLHDANRNMPLDGDTRFKELKENYAQGRELSQKTLGIIGFGRTGQAVAKIAIGLGMKVVAYDPQIQKANITLSFFNGQQINFPIETTSKEEVLKQADFITIHIPSQQQAVITEADFDTMKNGVGIINLSRGDVFDEELLLENLDDTKVAFAGLDVFQNEPEPSVKLLMHPKISLSPHIGASTLEAQERIGNELALKIISFFNKK